VKKIVNLSIHNHGDKCELMYFQLLTVHGMLPGTGTLPGSAKALGPTRYLHMPQRVTSVPGT